MIPASLPLIPCVGGIVHDDLGRLLLVRRGHEPGMGLWSVPGGRVEQGESDEAAVVREVAEETGLYAVVVRVLGSVLRPAPGGGTFVIRDYLMALPPSTTLPARPEHAAAEPVAGDDASAARWLTRAELQELPLVDGLLEALGGWGVLPR